MASHDCAICMDTYKSPRMISCGHSYCTQCLELLLEQSSTNWCPLCKQVFYAVSVSHLPRNFALEDSIVLTNRLALANAFGTSESSSRRCLSHPNNISDSFCFDCKKQVCFSCVTSDSIHSSHMVKSADEALDQASTLLRNLLARARRDEAVLLAVEPNKTQQTRLTIESDGETEIHRINDRFDRLVTDLRAIQEKLTRDVRVTVQTALRQLDRDNGRLLTQSRSIIDRVDELLRSNNVEDMVLMADRIKFELDRIEAAADKKRSWMPKSLFDEEFNTNLEQLSSSVDTLRLQCENHKYFHLNSEKESGTIMCVGECRAEKQVAAEIYDSVTNRWVRVSSISVKSSERAATFVNSKAIVSGGRDGQSVLDRVECFDTEANSWCEVGKMLSARCGHAMVSLAGYLYAVGGHDGTHYLSSVERCDFNQLSGQWVQNESMLLARDQPACTPICNKLLVAGGFDGNTTHSSCEMFNPETNRWVFVASMKLERSAAAIASWNDYAFIFGGSNSDVMHMDSIEQYDPITDNWTLFETRMIDGRDGHGVATLNDEIFIIGGWGKPGELSSVERFNPIEKSCLLETSSLLSTRGNVAVTYCDIPVEVLLRSVGLAGNANRRTRDATNETASAIDQQ